MPSSVTKVSPVDAALVALAALAGEGAPPAPAARVIDGAELAWCQALSIPSVRQLARAIDRAPSTVVRDGSLLELYAAVIGREWSTLDAGWFAAHPKARPAFFRAHAGALGGRDHALLRLPGLVIAAVASAGLPAPARLAVPWCSLAAFAGPRETLAISA